MNVQLFTLLTASVFLAASIPTAAQTDFEGFQQQRDSEFETYKKTLEEQFAAFKSIHREETERFQAEISTVWTEPEISTQTTWVEYSDDLTERTTVDFDAETITIETVSSEASALSVETLTSTLTELVAKNRADAFADDVIARAVEQRAVVEIEDLRTAEVEPVGVIVPYLTGMLEVGTARIKDIVEHMVENVTTTTLPGKGDRTVHRLEVPLIAPEPSVEFPNNEIAPKSLPNRAKSIWGHVSNFSTMAEVEPSLIYAVIETESSFNPFAKSPVPAYGLMQIVPESGGKDATQKLNGAPQVLSPSYLYNVENNIQIGTTYMNVLYYKYLKRVNDPLSRLYCSIAAYNAGIGRVSKIFTGSMKIEPAVDQINRMTSDRVYSMLETKLPNETRQYLKKVSTRKEKYEKMGI